MEFSDDVDTSTFSGVLNGADGEITGSWDWNDKIVTFTPSAPFEALETFTLSVSVADMSGNTAEKTQTFTVKGDEVAPSIIHSSPAADAVNVDNAAGITISFSADVLPDSTVFSLIGVVQGRINVQRIWLGATVTLTPLQPFLANDMVTVVIAMMDQYENKAVENFTFRIKADQTYPVPTVIVPTLPSLMGRLDTITLAFPDDIAKNTVSVSLNGSLSGSVDGRWSWQDNSYVFTPNGYEYGEDLVLSVEASDVSGNTMPSQTYDFTVKLDDTAPSLLSSTPSDNDSAVNLSSTIVLRFTDDAIPDSTEISISGQVQGNIAFSESWSGTTVTLTPADDFLFDDRVTVHYDCGDQYANYLNDSVVFYTSGDSDAPYYTVTVSTGISYLWIDDTITVSFSNLIELDSVELELRNGGGSLIGGSWDVSGRDYTFTPATGYSPGDILTLSVEADNRVGRPIESGSHSLMVKDDNAAPVIVSRNPENGETSVPAKGDIVVELSADVVADSTTVTLMGEQSGEYLSVLAWDGREMTIDPVGLLQSDDTITVTVSTADIFGNRADYQWSFKVRHDSEAPGYEPVTSVPTDRLPLNAVITVSFSADIDSTSLEATVSGSASGEIEGAWSWRGTDCSFKPSGQYSPGETLTLTFSASDMSGNVMPLATETFTVGEHVPWLAIDEVTQSEINPLTYVIQFHVGDPDGNKVRMRNFYYSVDGAPWVAVNASALSLSGDLDPGNYSMEWSLPDATNGVYSNDVRFAFEVYDVLYNSGRSESPSFFVDRNTVPDVHVGNLSVNETAKRLTIPYTITDTEHNTVALSFFYSRDNGETWNEGEVLETISALGSSKYTGNLTWVYDGILEEGIDYFGVRVKLSVADFKQGGEDESNAVNIDLNTPPSLVLDDFFTTQNGDVPITYHISDAEQDSVSLICSYSVDGGSSWKSTESLSGNTDITEYDGTVIWHSKKDLPTISSFSVKFRAVPVDHDEGSGDETGLFQLFNNSPPKVSVAYPDSAGMEAVLSLVITDNENDKVDALVQWSIDGENWNTATVTGDTDDLTPGGTAIDIAWQSGTDIYIGYSGLVFVRVSVFDTANPQGSSVINSVVDTIHIDRKGPIPEKVWATVGSDTVYVAYNELVLDSTALDPAAYSLSHGLNIGSVEVENSGLSYFAFVIDDVLPFEVLTLTVKGVSDRYGNVTDSVDIEFYPEDDNANPSVAFVNLSGEVAGNVIINYAVTDSEGDDVSLYFEYSIDDGANWNEGSTLGTTSGIGSDNYDGAFVWRSSADLPSIETDGVLLRLTAADLQSGDPVVSEPLFVDNNNPPSVILSTADPDSVYSGEMELFYQLSDAESDTLSLKIEYSLDNGDSYHIAEVEGKLEDISVDYYNGVFVWDTDAVLPDDFGTAIIRMTASDNDNGAPATLPVSVDNYGAVQISLSVESSEHSGDVAVSYVISDPQGRAVTLGIEYSLDGSIWFPATVTGNVASILPAGYESSFTWKSGVDANGREQSIYVRVTPDNGKAGLPGILPVAVDNNDVPVLTLDEITGEQSGEITVQFSVLDTERDPVDVEIYYSIDNGTHWYQTELKEAPSGLSSGGTKHSAVWLSASDLPGRVYSDVMIRAAASDGDTGNFAEIGGITIDNNAVPAIELAIDNPDSVYDSHVDINHVLSDAENNMLSLLAEYSTDEGETWHTATVTGKTSSIFSGEYSASIRWEILTDLGGYYGSALFRVTPSDDDAGVPAAVELSINTFGNCSISINTPGTADGDERVTVQYSITDENHSPVSLTAEYSTDGGELWQSMTVDTSLKDIPASSYQGSFDWLAIEDIDGIEALVLIRVSPDNGSPGSPAYASVSADYNKVPVFSELLTDTETVYSGTISLSFMMSDAENDILTADYEYSLDGGTTWLTATMSGGKTILPGRLIQADWDSFRDAGFGQEMSVYFRFIPKDNDSGEAAVVGPFTISNLVGDFNFDSAIDGRDLPTFIDAWANKDYVYETGPVSGAPPAIKVTPDSLFNIEDLSAFVWMWNWYSEESAGSEKAVAAKALEDCARTEDSGVLDVSALGDGTIVMSTMRSADYLSVTVVAEDGEALEIGAVDTGFWGGGSLFLSRKPDESVFELACGRFGQAKEQISDIAVFNTGRGTGAVTIGYRVRFEDSPEIFEGTARIAAEDLYSRPEAFSLAQNSPNPFNPSTLISYSLPEDAYVKLVVRSITGQVVETLRDEAQTAGFYSLRFDASGLASGMYFYTIRAGSFVQTKKMTVVK